MATFPRWFASAEGGLTTVVTEKATANCTGRNAQEKFYDAPDKKNLFRGGITGKKKQLIIWWHVP